MYLQSELLVALRRAQSLRCAQLYQDGKKPHYPKRSLRWEFGSSVDRKEPVNTPFRFLQCIDGVAVPGMHSVGKWQLLDLETSVTEL